MSTNEERRPDFDLWGGLLQLAVPAEFRIHMPLPYPVVEVDLEESKARPSDPPESRQDGSPERNRLLCELVTCLWYLQTKYFKKPWNGPAERDDDPRVRKALGRIRKAVEMFTNLGLELHDPTGERYPGGGEGLMRPLQFLPARGVSRDRVSETVTPIIYHGESLLQRGEVFVEVPDRGKADDQPPAKHAAGSDSASDGDRESDAPATGASGDRETSTDPVDMAAGEPPASHSNTDEETRS